MSQGVCHGFLIMLVRSDSDLVCKSELPIDHIYFTAICYEDHQYYPIVCFSWEFKILYTLFFFFGLRFPGPLVVKVCDSPHVSHMKVSLCKRGRRILEENKSFLIQKEDEISSGCLVLSTIYQFKWWVMQQNGWLCAC